MKRIIAGVLVVALFTSGLLVGCDGMVTGSGNLKTESYDHTDFTRVRVSSAVEYEITRSDSYQVSITADDNIFDYIQVSRQGTTLQIGLGTASFTNITVRAEITMPQLRSLDISGASRGSVSGFSSTEDIDITVSGASYLDLTEMTAGDANIDITGASAVTGDLAAVDVSFNVNGASNLQLEGRASDIVVKADGASRVKLGGFTTYSVDISLDGASTGTINLVGKLDANLSGASKLEYIGEPTMGTIDISGASTLNKK